MKPEWKSRLLRKKDELVRSDVFVHLELCALEMIRRAVEEGLASSGFELAGDAAILRFKRNESRKPLQEE